MALVFLQLMLFAGGVIAILYALISLAVLKNRRESRKSFKKYELEKYLSRTERLAIAEVFWRRANIFLQNGRVDAAYADCKQALKINPDHAAAKRLWNQLFAAAPDSEAASEKVKLTRAVYEKFNSTEKMKNSASENPGS